MFFYSAECGFFLDVHQTFPVENCCDPQEVKIPKHAFAFRFIDASSVEGLCFLNVFDSGGRIRSIPPNCLSPTYYYGGKVYNYGEAEKEFAHNSWLTVESILKKAPRVIYVGGWWYPFYPSDIIIAEGSLEELDPSLLRRSPIVV